VFNVARIEGLPAYYYAEPRPKGEKLALIESAEQFFAATGAIIRHGGNMAYYAPGPDVIQLPVPEAFRDAESYAATKAHELTHWTKHPSRLDRDFGGTRFGDAGYAREELVAELGAAFLCADLGITPSRARITPRIWRIGSRSSARTSARSSPPPLTPSAPWTSFTISDRRRTRHRQLPPTPSGLPIGRAPRRHRARHTTVPLSEG
jgi:antirestriction protein ArdC